MKSCVWKTSGERLHMPKKLAEVVYTIGVTDGALDKGVNNMGLTAMWTHGHAALAETQNVQIGSIGWGALIQAPQNSFNTEWIHYNIPTPVILNDVRPKILRVMILFDTFNGGAVNSGAITNVHVWDRNNRILQIDGLELTGGHLNLDGTNRFE